YAYISLLERSVKAVRPIPINYSSIKVTKEKISSNKMNVEMWKNGSASYKKEYLINTDIMLTNSSYPDLVIVKEARLLK
ncbi:hypothetical protein ACFCP7_29075, partial [Paenibacillus elgii]